MKKVAMTLCMLAACAVWAGAQTHARARRFSGQIMDSQCATQGNHDAGYKMTGTHTRKDCTLACVKAGGQFVLYNARTKTTYKLDNQDEPRAYAGDNVRVLGTYDQSTQTIHVEKISRVR